MSDGDVESELDEHDRRIGENSMKSSKALVRINELEAENKQLRERIERLEAIVESNPDDVEYERKGLPDAILDPKIGGESDA